MNLFGIISRLLFCTLNLLLPHRRSYQGCSNDSNFPKEWLRDDFRSHMLHPTPLDCCNAFLAGKQCKAYESGCVYSAATCEGGKWHPDALTRTGCSNDEPPESWDDAKLATVMYDSAADCCQVYHSGGTCAVRHKCKTGVEYLTVTARPTEVPTRRPSSEPTPLPTLPPTAKPTNSPTAPPTPPPTTAVPTYSPTSVWYVDHFTGVCHHTATSGETVPHYIASTYGDAGECCESSFNSEKCMDALPEDVLMDDGTSDPTSSPVPTPSPKYYVDQLSQTCIASVSETMPHWINDEDTFDNPAECCKSVPAGWEEQCREKSVRVTPSAQPVTWRPTYSPTQFFTGVSRGEIYVLAL